MEASLEKMEKNFNLLDEKFSTASKRVSPLQSLSMANKALETRINRAVPPALPLLESFNLSESLQHKLLQISTKFQTQKNPEKRLHQLVKYLDCVDQLNDSINSISQQCEPTIQKLQEVVEFLSRTKAADQFRILRLKETLVTLKALYEAEVDAMRFDGLLDEALLNLHDEFEFLLLQLKHENIEGSTGEEGEEEGQEMVREGRELGSELEVEVLRRISETLAANDCLDICIDIFVKVRYRRAAKALMRLNPDYLKSYTPEEIDSMEWETLETAISLWIQHFELAVKTVFVSEKNLCNQVLSNIMEGSIWPECFIKISDKIMAVFFRFGEGVARSNKEPQKLFKLLDMFDSLEELKPEFSQIFDGEAGEDICLRYRELLKLLVHASSKVFWQFGLLIEGNQDRFQFSQDGSVPKLVRYTINYFKCLASEDYSEPMVKVLKTEQIWKQGSLAKPETDDNLLKDEIFNVMEALQRNVESKKLRYRDKVLPHIFSMNTYWYIYMRSRNSELGKLLGDQVMKKKYKVVAEESAYMYQKQAWGYVVRFLEREEIKSEKKEAIGVVIRGKLEAFMKGLDEIRQRHWSNYSIPDVVLREQIKEATAKLVVNAYTEFVNEYSSVLQVKSYLPPELIKGLIEQIFDGGDGEGNVNVRRRERDQRDLSSRRNSISVVPSGTSDEILYRLDRSYEMKDFGRFR
ncbi:Exocyst complex subunit Exo70, C-terminal [Dillenia turbinata]|uniref:Exocyst subunit Exo70 family protein n=1 Tax=Dillenia turbinata TaxID=194707 RepID=A0AAN8VVM4_9MAGN